MGEMNGKLKGEVYQGGRFVPDKEPHYKPGHMETLTADQEHVLKEVWAVLLKKMGYQVSLPSKLRNSEALIHRTYTGASSHTMKSTATTKKGRFGKLGKKKHHDNVDAVTDKLSKLSTDPGFTLQDERVIDQTLHNFKPEQVKDNFFNFLRHDTPDNLILRFVRARKFSAANSLKMVTETLRWRVEDQKADEILLGNELAYLNTKGVINAFQVGKLIFRGFDKSGRPLVVVRPRFHYSSQQTEKETEIFTVLVIEYLRLLLNEPVDSATIIFDLTGFSLSNMDYHPVKFMIKIFEAHYPESLGVLLIHKLPWVFGGIWSVVKNWLDPVVASKINFTRNTKDLNKFITPPNLTKDLGGEDSFQYKYIPPSKADLKKPKDALYEELNEERKLLIEEFIQLTIKWIESDTQESSNRFKNDKILIGRELANNYIDIYPYLVNRTFYHKIHTIDPQKFDIFYDSNC